MRTDDNYRMRILSAVAISFVVLGHINFYAAGHMDVTLTEPLTFQGWFPYYSFHLPLFLFISGYFFRDLPEGNPLLREVLRFAGKKAVKLLLPYYIFSGLSLLLTSWLQTRGFPYWDSFSLTAWLVSPWTEPFLITFSTPVWYLTALFIAEIFLMILRTVLRKLFRSSLARETVLLAITLAAGIAAVYFNETAAPSGTAVVYLRSVVMLCFIQAGILYRRHLEKHDKLKNRWYFLIVFGVQFLLILLSGNDSLNPGLFALVDFGKTGFAYFIGGVTGIMLWLRISTIAASLPRQSRVVSFIGKNTKYIMALHIFSWFLLNTLLNLLHAQNPKLFITSGFSSRWYHSFLYYCNTSNPRMILLYFAAGMALPLGIAWAVQAISRLLRRTASKPRLPA